MYDVYLQNGSARQIIHYHVSAANAQKLDSGTITDAVNSISSFSFSLNPKNVGYAHLNPYTSHVYVYNSHKGRYDFIGRVLQVSPQMDSSGQVSKSVMCEDRLGYLHDSIQPYTPETYYAGDETRTGLEHFIDLLLTNHNAQVEPYKQIHRGQVTVEPFESSDGVYKGLNWESTMDCIKSKLLDSFGGYIRLRENNGLLYLDYLANVGETRSTTIEVARNMRSATKEIDTSGIITRLVPLGAKLKEIDAEGNERETGARLTIESVNDGRNYIAAADYEAQYGIKYATVTFDDVNEPANLLRKGTEYITEHNGLAISHDIDALDLSLIGLDIDDFVLYDRYPVRNPAIGIDDILQIIKKTTNIIEPHKSTFEMGDIVKRLSDAVTDYTSALNTIRGDVAYVNTSIKNQTNTIVTYVDTSISNIQMNPEAIWAAVENQAASKSEYETFAETVRNILQMEADGTTMIFQTITEAISEVEGVQASQYAEILSYIRFTAEGIEIGEEGNPIIMRLGNDSLDFYNNGTRVAYLSDNTLYITDGRFLRSVRIGNYGFIPEANGSVSFTYIGGGS